MFEGQHLTSYPTARNMVGQFISMRMFHKENAASVLFSKDR